MVYRDKTIKAEDTEGAEGAEEGTTEAQLGLDSDDSDDSDDAEDAEDHNVGHNANAQVFALAAEQGPVEAQHALAAAYDIPHNADAGWFALAAEQGWAQWNLVAEGQLFPAVSDMQLQL